MIQKAKSFANLIVSGKDKDKAVYEKVGKGITKFKFRGKYLYTFKTKIPAQISIIKSVQSRMMTRHPHNFTGSKRRQKDHQKGQEMICPSIIMYCIVDSSITSYTCADCTLPRASYQGYCLCPSFLQQLSSNTCQAQPYNSAYHLYQAFEGLLLAAFLVQFILMMARVSTPFSWRAWGFLQACCAATALPVYKDYVTIGLIRTLHISKGYYWLPQLYPGIQLKRNINLLLTFTAVLIGFLLFYLILERFYSKGFLQYLKNSWCYLTACWLILMGNETFTVLAYNLQFAKAITTDQIGLSIGLLVVVVAVAGLIKAMVEVDGEPGEPLSMTQGVSKFINLGWIVNLLATGFVPFLILKNSLIYLIFAVAAGLPLFWLALSLIFEKYSLKNVLVAGVEIILWGLALLFISLEIVDLKIGLLICLGTGLLVILGEMIYLRVTWGSQDEADDKLNKVLPSMNDSEAHVLPAAPPV